MRMIVRRARAAALEALLRRVPVAEIRRCLDPIAAGNGEFLAWLDYRFESRRRWTEAAPHPGIHALLACSAARYDEWMARFSGLADAFARIEASPASPLEPGWLNTWIPAIDAVALYGFIALGAPRTYLEVGSGNSTRFARRAVRDHGLATRIVSVDPEPRAEIDALCDTVMRTGLERADLGVFDGLVAGDVVFFDGSHRALMNSDATVFFLDVLPRLAPGVLIGVHDIFWPCDYPESWADRWYSEQYLLGQLLLGRPDLEVQFPSYFVSSLPGRDQVPGLEGVWSRLPAAAQRSGGAFWFTLGR